MKNAKHHIRIIKVHKKAASEERAAEEVKTVLYTLEIQEGGVILNGKKIENCLSLEIKDINPVEKIEVVLHVLVDRIDVHHETMGRIEK